MLLLFEQTGMKNRPCSFSLPGSKNILFGQSNSSNDFHLQDSVILLNQQNKIKQVYLQYSKIQIGTETAYSL